MTDPSPISAPPITDPELTSISTPAPIQNGTPTTNVDVEMIDSQPIKTEVRSSISYKPKQLLTLLADTTTRTSYTRRRTHTDAQFTTPQ